VFAARQPRETDELDIRDDAWADARIEQLRGVYQAVAQLLVSFQEADPVLSSVSANALERARVVRSQPSDEQPRKTLRAHIFEK
jgi:hypothetical protein